VSISEPTTWSERADEVIPRVIAEMVRARRIHPPYASCHEAYAVLKEEVDEMWDEIKANSERIEEEAVQVAAVALTILIDCFGDRVQWPTAAPPAPRVASSPPAPTESPS
jgi:hypothetical protein